MSRVLKLLPLLCLLPLSVAAQEDVGDNIHWAYASFFGTGSYQVGNEKAVYVVRPAPRWTMREPGFEDDGSRRIGWQFRFPVALGVHEFDLPDWWELFEPDNLGSISFTPIMQATIPVTPRWSLMPVASFGYGTLTDGDESAWIYHGGIKSQLDFQAGKLDWALLNSVLYVGYTPDEGRSEGFVPLMAGLEFGYPLDTVKFQGDPLKLYWHATYTYFDLMDDGLQFRAQSEVIQNEGDQWELGFAIGKKDKRLQFWRFNMDRIGFAYTRASGDVHGFRIMFRSRIEY